MPWLKKAGEMPRNEKIWELSDPMYRLYDGSLHYCAENLTDGHVPASRITALTPKPATKPQIEALVTRRLWHRLPHLSCKSCIKLRADHHAGELPKSGYLVHDFLEFNPSKAEWDRRQEGRRTGGQRGAEARWGDGSTDDSSHSSSDGSSHRSSHDPLSTEADGSTYGSKHGSQRGSTDAPYPVPRTPSSGSIDPVVPQPGAEDDPFPDEPQGADRLRDSARRGGVRHVAGAAEAVVAAARGRTR